MICCGNEASENVVRSNGKRTVFDASGAGPRHCIIESLKYGKSSGNRGIAG